MAYSDDAVKAKLAALNETQDSIVTVAQWIMFHRRHANRTADLWKGRLQESSSASKRLTLLYLANEVVQQSRARQKQDFLLAFEPLIADATAQAYKGASQDIQAKIRRVVEVWRARNIFDQRIQEQTESKLDELDKTKSTSKLGGLGGGRLGGSLFGGGGSGVASELEGVNKSQIALTKADAASRGPLTYANAEWAKINDPNTPVPSAPVRAAKLRGLVKTLMAAHNAVDAGIKARQEVLAGLEKLVESHRAKIAEEETTARDLRSKIDTMEGTIREVEDSIMRGADSPTNGNGTGYGPPEPQRPEMERFTPPPPDVEALTPPAQDIDATIGDIAPLDKGFSNPTGADPVQEQLPNLNEPPPSFVPPPALPNDDSISAATTAKQLLETLSSAQGLTRSPSGELPAGNPADPRLKRRKLSHKSSNDVDDEIFGSGGVDEDSISAMLGQ
ncbi:uncharacterized protein MYCFIDRAFT_152900 [Pseudocercospora fijiensis CIRAD86]|uniref:CID domain-containing protein n=1 Tax=Pseudocercospora fijiensis (strain CIRAD86) TaxID=383855 RepID=M3AJD0_PSEFD|nr:uncharacterized protein MYCFIDRAFT_152900 [Pseudocercospora fijiensis CIRAD86]EME84686.1 hypothetical protein MYCFIDRAFT_152900 [Pseudocercospora fijiensis CIRAD86]